MTIVRTYRLWIAVGLLAVFAPGIVRAQTGSIAGRVTDDAGAPLPGVNLVVVHSILGAASRSDGTYRIENVPAGPHTIAASAVGYERAVQDIVVEPGTETRVDFTLNEIAIQSGEVVVTASRRGKLTGDVAASVSTMTPREIEARNAVSLDEALRYVSGIQMAGNQINIRGSSGFSYNTGSRVLLLIDGAPMLRPDADGIPYDAVPMAQVQRIEVLKGPGSALYGGGALGGVINVITKDYPESPATSLSAYGGAYQPVRYEEWRRKWDRGDEPRPMAGVTAGHARPIGRRAGIWTHVAYRYDAGHLRLSRRENVQAYTKLTWRPERDARLFVLAGLNRRKSDSFLFWNGARDPLNPGRIDFGRSDESAGSDDNLINELSLLPSYTNIVTQNLLVTARARFFGVLIQPLDDADKAKPLSQGTVGFRYGGELQGDYSPTDSRTMTLGATADANATRSSYFEGEGPLSQPEGSVFVQWEEIPSEGLTLAAGARYDVYRVRRGVVETKLSPKLSASYALSSRWIVRGAFGEGFRVPSVAERFVSNSDYLPVVAHPGLLPETNRSYEVGIRSFPALGIGSAVADVAAFWSDYRRLVEPKFVPAESAFQFVNLTKARIRGIEATGSVSAPNGRGSLDVGYTYLDAEDLTEARPLVFRSSHLLKLSASTKLWGVELGADFRFASEPDRVDSDFATFIKDAEVMVPTRVLDLRAATRWRGIEATLHVKNALDYYYVERPALLAPPRHLILQVATQF